MPEEKIVYPTKPVTIPCHDNHAAQERFADVGLTDEVDHIGEETD